MGDEDDEKTHVLVTAATDVGRGVVGSTGRGLPSTILVNIVSADVEESTAVVRASLKLAGCINDMSPKGGGDDDDACDMDA